MRSINNGVRKTVIKITRIIVWSELIVDILFFIFFYFTDGLTRSIPSYLINKIMLPFVVNMTTFLIFKKYNDNKDHSMLNKNVVCAFALTTIAGSAGVFHSYYVPLWLTPSLVMLFCTIFHSDRLQRWLLIYDYILVIMGCALVCWENPYDTSYYIQNAVVVIIVATLFNMLASVMNKYNQEMVGLTRNFHDKQMEYKEKLETDFLTKLFSREYVEKEAEEALSFCSEDNPCSIAMIDLDRFKNINDTFGHENGDKVLETFGKVIADYMNDFLIAGRFGGEEFVLVFEGGDFDSHVMVLEDIRERFSRQIYDFTDQKITLSGGIRYCGEPVPYQEALKDADEALYVSKKEGRNRITVSGNR